jgi:hypothetical protein
MELCGDRSAIIKLNGEVEQILLLTFAKTFSWKIFRGILELPEHIKEVPHPTGTRIQLRYIEYQVVKQYIHEAAA